MQPCMYTGCPDATVRILLYVIVLMLVVVYTQPCVYILKYVYFFITFSLGRTW